ncbi:MAG: hypothetical protein ABW133_19520, partial [Polyangiaceae bacterium]
RLLAFAGAIPLVGGALLPWHGEHAGAGSLSLIAGLALAFVALGLSIEKHHREALAVMFALPGAVFAYLGLVMLLVPTVPALTYVLAAGALFLLAIAARPSMPTRGLPTKGARSHSWIPHRA